MHMETSSQLCLPGDFRSLALSQVEEAAARVVTQVEVPDSAVGHIIGKSHRTINALRQIPGITHVSVHEDLEDDSDKQFIQVEGSADAVAKVLAQIKRLHMRSYAASLQPEMQYSCFVVGGTQNSQSADPLILRIASPDKLLLYMPQHLRTFLYRNFPEDFDDRTYYYFHSRSSGEAAAIAFIVQRLPPSLTSKESPDGEKLKLSHRKKLLEKTRASQIFGSWESTAYRDHLADTFSKLLLELHTPTKVPAQAGHGDHIKLRLVIGKTLLYGTDLRKSGLWKLSVDQMDEKILDQTLRPFFSTYSSGDSVCKAREYLCGWGYERVSESRTTSVQLVDMDSELLDTKDTYHLKLNEGWDSNSNEHRDEEPVVWFHKVAKKHTFLTFLNDHKGVDLELRIQSRQSEVALDPNTSKLLFESWHKLSGAEDTLVLPSGKRYCPLNLLHKDAETYSKEGFEVVITEVTAGGNDALLGAHEGDPTSRWKISIRSLQLRDLFLSMIKKSLTQAEIGNNVQDILHHVDLLRCESSKLAASMSAND